ncbi:MAG: hypothetical protein GXO82_09950 [Chlorobi bacterium]|nr:hypothetical protein [Chlorobiota bacterium]
MSRRIPGVTGNRMRHTAHPRERNIACRLSLVVLPLLLLACGSDSGELERYGGWNIEPFNYTFQVFVIHGNESESDLRSAADSLSRQYLESYETVELVFTRDKGLAEELASSKAREQMLQGAASLDPGKLMLHGGSWYRRDRNSDHPEWLYYPQPASTNP